MPSLFRAFVLGTLTTIPAVTAGPSPVPRLSATDRPLCRRARRQWPVLPWSPHARRAGGLVLQEGGRRSPRRGLPPVPLPPGGPRLGAGRAGHAGRGGVRPVPGLYPRRTPHLVFASYRRAPGDTSVHPSASLWVAERTADGLARPSRSQPCSHRASTSRSRASSRTARCSSSAPHPTGAAPSRCSPRPRAAPGGTRWPTPW